MQSNTTSHLSNTTQLNGLDAQMLATTAGAIAENPALAPVSFRAKSTWQGRFRSRTQIDSYDLGGQRLVRRHQIESDEPEELMGTNTAPNPQDLLLAGLNACMLVGFVVAATTRGIELESLSIESSLSLDLRGAFGLDEDVPPGAERVQYRIEVKGNASREQFEEIHAEVTRNSPNRWHLSQPLAFDSELVVR